MLTNDAIVRVAVNTSAPAPSPTAFDTGLILCQPATFTEAKRLKTYVSAAALLADGYQTTDEPYKAALKYFSASPAPSALLLSCYPSTETPAQALAAVLELTVAFYGVYICDATRSTLAALAAAISASDHPMTLFYAVGEDDADLFAALKATGTCRALGLYSELPEDGAAVMGLAMGLAAAMTAGAFALCYKTLRGVSPADLTEAEVSAIKAENGNVYVTRGFTRTVLENGATASGLRYDEVLYPDMICSDLQEAAVSILADAPGKLPQTDAASAVFINAFVNILSGYAARGVLATAPWRGGALGPLQPGDVLENGFALWAESYDTQSDADRAAHKAMPVHAALALSGSAETLVITVNITT